MQDCTKAFVVLHRALHLFVGERHLPGGLHHREAEVCRLRPSHSWPIPEEAVSQGTVPNRGAVSAGCRSSSHTSDLAELSEDLQESASHPSCADRESLCRLTCSLMQHGRNNGKKLLAVST